MQEATWTINGEQLTDRELVNAIMKGEKQRIVATFFYQTCLPLFASTYTKYYTDCESVIEFINQIYAYILYEEEDERTDDRSNCKLAKFGFRCSLITWLKVVAENYCHCLFSKKMQRDENILTDSDRFDLADESIESNIKSLNTSDVRTLLDAMPNERYRKLIEYRYLHEMSNEETANLLSMTMANYYNKHKLAKEQFCAILKKEGLI